MNKIYAGIDIGKQGFITIYDDTLKTYEFIPLPKIGNEIDELVLDGLIKSLKSEYEIIHCVIEDLHSVFGSSSKSTFNFGYVVGIVNAILVANRISFTRVAPKKWQKLLWEGIPVQKKPSGSGLTMVNDTKLMSEMAAKRLFPTLDFRRTPKCKKNDDNLVDSCLLAYYCYRNFKN